MNGSLGKKFFSRHYNFCPVNKNNFQSSSLSIFEEEKKRILALEKQQVEEKELAKRREEEHRIFLQQQQRLRKRVTPRDLELEELLAEINRIPPRINIRENSVIRQKKIETKDELFNRNISAVTKLAQSGQIEPCSICYDDECNENLIMVCCKQYFCFPCIESWWREKKTCPACRTEEPLFIEII